MKVSIAHIESLPPDLSEEDYFIKCRTGDGRVILMWASQEEGNRNVESVKHQDLPIVIEIASPEECGTDGLDENRGYWFSVLNASMSIAESNQVTVLVDA